MNIIKVANLKASICTAIREMQSKHGEDNENICAYSISFLGFEQDSIEATLVNSVFKELISNNLSSKESLKKISDYFK